MLKSLVNTLASPLTKYMTIALLALATALAGAIYLSYKFYGEKEAAEVVTEHLETVVKQEKKQTERAIESTEIIDEAVSAVRSGSRELQKASEALQDKLSKSPQGNPTGEVKNETESTTEPCTGFLSDDDIRLLQQAHCLTDGDPSDCY